MKFKKLTMSVFMFLAMCISINAHAKTNDFYGIWKGNISGLSVKVTIWAYGSNAVEDINATMVINNYLETIQVLGYKPSHNILYFFRKADKAPFAMYRKNGIMYLEYWEATTPARKIVMSK